MLKREKVYKCFVQDCRSHSKDISTPNCTIQNPSPLFMSTFPCILFTQSDKFCYRTETSITDTVKLLAIMCKAKKYVIPKNY